MRRTGPSWMKHIRVGLLSITVWDYRCEHNPEGKLGGCARCTGRKLKWATPAVLHSPIKHFDSTGETTVFPAFELRTDEAEVIPEGQDLVAKRAAMTAYRAAVVSGEHKVNHRTIKAQRRSMRVRRTH